MTRLAQMKCCPNCFNHPWLVEFVEQHSAEKGECNYCDSEDVPLLDVAQLSGLFQNMLTIYRPLLDGETIDRYEDPISVGDRLVQMIQDDWEVFSDEFFCSGKAERLLEEIANADWDDDSGESPVDANELYTRRESIWHSSQAEKWEEFCDEVRENPYLEPFFAEILGEDLWRLESPLKAGSILYRARLGFDVDDSGRKLPYRGAGIGAPPPEKSEAGRANRKGKVVLYAGDQEKTAIAEKRPARGLLVSVGQLRPVRDLRILDLARQVEVPNPFTDEPLRWWVEFAELVDSFGWALSKPMEREDDPAEYAPSQKLSEYVEAVHFDGIRYPSAMEPDGTNIVLFDPAVVEILQSKLVRVTRAEVEYENV